MTTPPRHLRRHPDGRLAALLAIGDLFDIEAPDIPVVDIPPQAPPPAQRIPADQELPAPESGVAFRIPILMLEGWETSDGRYWEPGTVGRRDLPQTLMAMRRNPDGGFEGHDAAIINGRIDHAERFDAAEEINRETGQPFGPGVWAWRADGWLIGDTDETASTIRYVRDGVLRGVSVDLAEAAYEIDVLELDADGWPVRDRVRFTQSSIAQATLTPAGAFPGAYIELADEQPLGPEQLPQVAAARDAIRLVRTAPLIASAGPAPLRPPRAWFTNQHQPDPSRHVYLGRRPDGTPTGQVWGYVARWGVPHAAIRSPRTYAPRLGAAGYRTFLSGSVLTEEGEEVATGPLTHGGGHLMDLRAGVQAALAHYDNAGTAYADVVMGEDDTGIWYAGAMRPSLTVEQIETFGRHPLSGDWRGDPGDVRERLCAVLSVNTAGFPMARAAADGGLAMVAAGAMTLGERSVGVDAGAVQAAIDRAVAPVMASAARSALARLTRRGA